MSPLTFLTSHHPDSPRALATSYVLQTSPSRLPLHARGPYNLPRLYPLLSMILLAISSTPLTCNCIDKLMNSKSFMSQTLDLYTELPNGHLLLDRPQAPQTQHVLNWIHICQNLSSCFPNLINDTTSIQLSKSEQRTSPDSSSSLILWAMKFQPLNSQ